MKFLLVFFLLTFVNVTASTVKTLLTIKGGKTVAAISSGLYFAYYNIVLIYTVADFPLWQKCAITFVCNVIGVYIVKYMEEKMRKDRMWKIEATFRQSHKKEVIEAAESSKLPYNYVDVGSHVAFNFYCASKQETTLAKDIIRRHEGKFFVTESILNSI